MTLVKGAFLISGIFLMLAACQQPSESAQTLQESLFVDGCTSPCWFGIQPRVTDIEEAKEILVSNYSEESIVVTKNWIDLSVDGENLLKAGNFSIGNGVIQENYLVLNEEINTGDLISILGTPTYVLVDGVQDCLGVELWLKDDGIFAYLSSSDTPFKGVSETQSVTMLRLTAIGAIEESQIYDTTLVAWDGYKDYCQVVLEK